MERAAELSIIATTDWDFFSTLTFKGTPSESIRYKTQHAFLHQVARGFRVPFRSLLWCFRDEEGAINGKEHFHDLLGGLPAKAVTKGGAFFINSIWNRVSAGGRRDTYQVVWSEGTATVRDDARYFERDKALARLRDVRETHTSARIQRNLAGGMCRTYVYDRRLCAASYILKQVAFDANPTDAKHSYETLKFGSEYVDQLTLANALLIHAARCAEGGKGNRRRRQTPMATEGRGMFTPAKASRIGRALRGSTSSDWSKRMGMARDKRQ